MKKMLPYRPIGGWGKKTKSIQLLSIGNWLLITRYLIFEKGIFVIR